jgi:hypothetical protein
VVSLLLFADKSQLHSGTGCKKDSSISLRQLINLNGVGTALTSFIFLSKIDAAKNGENQPIG